MIDSHTVERVQKAIDYECSSLRYWIKMCVQNTDLELAGKYQLAHNVLLNLREKIASPEYLEQDNLTGYEKPSPIYLKLSFRPE